MSNERIAIVGIGLRYPDAGSTAELWENVLAGRRAFRRLPDERMNRADYWSPDPDAADRFYTEKAAVLRDFEFDRVGYRVAGSTYRSTDLTHWLALDVAAQALADAGFPDGDGLPRQATGVVLGNSLTGEFSRANLMRLRWPYVRRTVASALAGKGWDEEETATFLSELETQYKAPFPPVDEDTLAGGLANTIAGRICNYFDLGGGGYTVDGACSSSLLSILTAGKALVAGDVDVAVAGGVDLSIDPFEVIGFAKTGALATGEMKVYDRDSNGFWPGEGSGLMVLMREPDALARGARIYASITGWGMSSDGKGGITRPEAGGHRLALARAYGRAGYGIETVSYFEGHGTGTAVGDATEIEALSTARRDADPEAEPAALSTIKANFGHTKAAAGVAGLIKAALAVHHQVIPPATGHDRPHSRLADDDAAMYVPDRPRLWPEDHPVRAGVSAMGFGGINTHIALQQAPEAGRRTELDARTLEVSGGRQDAELLMVDGADRAAVRDRVAQLVEVVPKLAFAELADLAATLSGELSGRPVRAAVVADNPEDAERKLTRLLARLDSGDSSLFSPADGVFLDHRPVPPAIAYLFPGQGSGTGAGSAIRGRFRVAEDVFRAADLPSGGDQVATQVAQPRIVSGSLAALRVLRELGIHAQAAAGHSLGELTALHWAGAMTGTQAQRLAGIRGRVMAEASRGDGAMAGLAIDPDGAERLVRGEDVVVAGYNGPRQTVISGMAEAVERVCSAAQAEGVQATRINVSHAFHSPSVEPAAAALADELREFEFTRLERPVASTVTGEVLHAAEDLRALLQDQVVLPVRFREAAATVAERADLVFEVGPGSVLTGLLAEIAPDVPALPVDTDSASLAGLLKAVGAAFALGTPVDTDALFAGRAVRPIPLDGSMTFLASPCEQAPTIDADLASDARAGTRSDGAAAAGDAAPAHSAAAAPSGTDPATGADTTLELLRTLAAERVELPVESISADTHPLDDLHLSSITVGQLVNETTRALGRPPLEAMPNFATVCLGDLAEMIDELAETAREGDTARGEVPGVADWVRPFAVEYVEQDAPVVDIGAAGSGTAVGDWTVYAPPGHPLAEPLRDALAGAGVGDGVLLCLPADCDESHLGMFLDAGRAALAAPTGTRFVVVQHGLGAAGLARTLRLEDPSTRTTIVDLAEVAPASEPGVSTAVRRVVTEVAATDDFAEVRYESDGRRTVPELTGASVAVPDPAAPPLEEDDVLLVTGGGKGITAECALAVARDTGARLALLGRADPDSDEELAANLARLDAAGVRYRYERADVTSSAQVRHAVDAVESELGTVTGVLHGAGRNAPAALFSLTEDAFRDTVAPKASGLRAVLSAVDESAIKLLVTFGSIIGRAGLRGEAHYATANDWMTELTLRHQRRNPHSRVLALEWSVWSGAGMGERLGVVEALKRDGITPVSTEDGIEVLRNVLADPSAGPVLVVGGRTSGLPTLPVRRAELPLARFVDRVVVHYPEIELITEADLSAGSDPYLEDHRLDGDLLFPAVMGMEAMTQVAAALSGRTGSPLLENVEFLRPVVVQPSGSSMLRVAALAREPGTVDVVVRSSETGFSADHFRARLRFPRPDAPGGAEPPANELPAVPVDPVTELYGGVLFQGKRFQRLAAYRRTGARRAVAEIVTGSDVTWFAPFLPQERVLADPGARDAMMHAIQCCVPDAILLPEGVERLYLADKAAQDAEYLVLDARERSQHGDSYVYDLNVWSQAGELVECWEGLTLRAVRGRDGAGPWAPAMLGPYLERALERVLGGSRTVVVEPDPAEGAVGSTSERRERTEMAVSRAWGAPVQLRYRPDGKPETDDLGVSASHGAGLTVAVVGPGRLACDVETVAERGAGDWADLLGAELLAVRDLLAAETGESESAAGTRVWCAMECVRKTGAWTQAVTVDRVHPDGWAALSVGEARVATWVTTIDGREDPVVFAVLEGEEC
ncbi:SDR family NAD(P)-dependent oxidoreductase [Haloechinothrix sp. YIM 98757]|uniref:SDR family NAD(P)-dependent oxidoreductase n=1 Tax=Haloechinothrix aidingensis TaxID=2752311 RepID=A0A838A7Y4_9PSEU|nr:type I polyketide synthase [Haloechinothrix aidingensis]MBA0125305.1 SDR family NAD(P)-dependent oxidoreductase [Haloechinothrix aidingensis]